MPRRRALLVLLGFFGAPACFTPVTDARFERADGGTGLRPDGGGLQCKPACPDGFVCDDGVCRPCHRDCTGRQCGDDGCGGMCGQCVAGSFCYTRGVCGACPASAQCGSSCCSPDQACVDGECVACGCGERVCGIGHCGEWCGDCRPGQACTTDGRCVGGSCSCEGRECGDDGCGQSCGECTSPKVCTSLGKCLATPCTCQGKECGDDGCGQSCGACPDKSWCLDGKCTCQRLCDWLQCGDDGCGGTCGDCAAGSTCQWGTCVPTSCEPPCDEFQWCDTSADWPVCVEICNPPTGCRAGEVCDVMSGRCQPATCSDALCPAGQGCFDPWTLGPGNVCTCLPGHYDGSGTWVPDTCSAQGLSCPWDYAKPQASACGAPGEFEECQIAVGCKPGFDCVDLGGGYHACLQPCSVTKDCLDPMTKCSTTARHHCWWAICARPESSPGDRQRYFKACASGAASDGICLPYPSQDSTGNPIDLGLCVQTGTALSVGKCSANANRTRMSELCPQGEWCEPTEPDPARPGERLGVCRRVCNAGPSPVPVVDCAAGEFCLDEVGGDPGRFVEARLGACHIACDILGAKACPPDALGNPSGCIVGSLDGEGLCQGTAPGAAGRGEACDWDVALDARYPCADRLFCNDQTGTCSGFCDTTACPDPATPCPACAPLSMCYPLGGKVGACL